MKKTYIAPDINMSKSASLVQIVCQSPNCKQQMPLNVVSDDPVGSSFSNSHVGSSANSVDANERGGFGSDSGPWESLW